MGKVVTFKAALRQAQGLTFFMPELPEVETIVRYLKSRISGRRILDFEPRSKRVMRYFGKLSSVRSHLAGQTIQKVERKGKFVVCKLSGGNCLLFHLMMTGQLLLNPKSQSPHDRLVIKLSGGTKLVFRDIRQFGFCKIVSGKELLTGEDPLAVSFSAFKNLISERKSAIKNLLLNQKILSGIGNIYADEILWRAEIHPLRKTSTLGNRELRRFYSSMRSVLRLAIKKEGTSARNYIKPDGKAGGYFELRKVYQRTGERCRRCQGIIKRIAVGQRSTHFCPKHQC